MQKGFFKGNIGYLAVTFGLAAFAGAGYHAAGKLPYYQAATVECPSAGGKLFTQHYDSVHKDIGLDGPFLIAKDQSRITPPANCVISLKPYAHS